MNFKKLLCLLCSVALCFTCAACNIQPNDNRDGTDKSDFTGGEIPDKNDVEVTEPDTTDHDFNLVSQGDGTFTYKCADCNEEEKFVITCESVAVISSYEGIEGQTVEISDGNVSVVSSDDGINGTATSGTTIAISGGKLYVYASGDGVDSNSQTSYEGINFTGGTSVIISTGQSNSSIDTERGYKYSGGFVIGIGRSGGMGSEATKCSNFSSVGTSKTLSLQKDDYLVVADIATVKMPVSMSALIVCLGKTSASISSSTSTSDSLDANGVYN